VSTDANYTFASGAPRSLVAIASIAPGELDIAWPASATGWVLEETADLRAASWALSTLPVNNNTGQNQVIVTNPTGSRFFRLRKP